MDGLVRQLAAVRPSPTERAEWNREMLALVAATGEPLHTAARLVEATTADPSYNLYEGEERTITTENPLNTAFRAIHGEVDPVAHFTRELGLSGHPVVWDADKRVFTPIHPSLFTLEF